MIGALPYLNSPVMAVSGAAAKIRRALGDVTPDVEAMPTTESILVRLQTLNARIVAISRLAPPTDRVMTMMQALTRATANAASDLRYATPQDAQLILEDIEQRVDAFQHLVADERVVIIPPVPGETRAFPGGAKTALLALAAVVAVGSVLVIARPRRKRRRR